MSKYNIQTFLKSRLQPYASSLHATSYDTANQQHLCQDELTPNVYDFDAYVKNNHPHHRLPASPDAIFLGTKKLYFIEFKNQLPENIDNTQLKAKFASGTNILKTLLTEFIPRDVEYIFCVVYQTKRSRYFNPEHIESNITRFGLDKKNVELGGFYSTIIAENVDFYKNNFQQLEC